MKNQPESRATTATEDVLKTTQLQLYFFSLADSESATTTATQTPTYLKVPLLHSCLAKMCKCNSAKVEGSTTSRFGSRFAPRTSVTL